MSRVDRYQINAKDGTLVTIRTAKEADAAQLLELGREVMSEGEFTLTRPDELNFTYQEEADWIRDHLIHPSKLLLVAEIGDEIVGLIDFSPGNRIRISHTGYFGMSVSIRVREIGIGNALLSALLKWGHSHESIEKMGLKVHATNARAIHLYQKLGFKEEGRLLRDLKYEDGVYVDTIMMSRFVK